MLCQICSGRYRGDEVHREWRKRYQLNPVAMDQLKITVCIVCLLFLILCMPKFFFLVYRYIVECHEIVEYSFHLEAQQFLVQVLCSLLEYIFLSFAKNIVFIVASSTYHSQLKCMFRKCCKSTDHNTNQETKDLLPNDTKDKDERYIEEWDSETYRYKFYREGSCKNAHQSITNEKTDSSKQAMDGEV